MNVVVLLLFAAAFAAAVAGACEVVLTRAEIAADRARAVEFFGAANTELGFTVSGAGDVNGDGFDDFALAAPYEQFAGTIAGAVYLVFGRSTAAWGNALFNFSEADTPDNASWVRITGAEINFLGYNGLAHGDFNGDGFSDLLLSSSGMNTSYALFGHAGAWSSFCISSIESSTVPGFPIFGGPSRHFAGNAGDMNGDGIEDILVTEFTGTSAPNIAFVVFGVQGSSRVAFDIGTIDGTNGFSFADGSEQLGSSGAENTVGDVNGDGIADLAIGSQNLADGLGGRAYVLFARNVSASGPWPISLNLTTGLDGTNGFVIKGPNNTMLGQRVMGAGDVNADGFADFFANSLVPSGGMWLVFGHAVPWPAVLDASLLSGTDGFHFTSASKQNWGRFGGAAGDINGDGFDDVVVGGSGDVDSFGTQTGAAAIIFGRAGNWPEAFGPKDVSGSVGFLIDGPSFMSNFGCSAQGAGDVNGDGLADFIIGAFNHSSWDGYAALIFGVNDHCAMCSNTTNDCLICEDGFVVNGGACHPTASSSTLSQEKSSSSSSSSTSAAATHAVVVIETGGGGTASEVAAEVAQLLGVDVGQISVVEITPGTFEVTVTNEEVAKQLVNLITQCIEQEAELEQL